VKEGFKPQRKIKIKNRLYNTRSQKNNPIYIYAKTMDKHPQIIEGKW
jgi:hypothetical protein